MLGIILISAASVASAHPAARLAPTSFDLATVNAAQRRSDRRRWMNPHIDELLPIQEQGLRLRFRPGKVKLNVPI